MCGGSSLTRSEFREKLCSLMPDCSERDVDDIVSAVGVCDGKVDWLLFVDWAFDVREDDKSFVVSMPLVRTVSDVGPRKVEPPPPDLRRAVSGAPTFGRHTRRADVQRAQNAFAQRITSGEMPMTDYMLLRLTSGKVAGLPPEEPKEATADAVGAPKFGEDLLTDASLVRGLCSICFEEGVDVAHLCGRATCGKRFCTGCSGRYAETRFQDALYTMPLLKCPGCTGRVPTAFWRKWVKDDVVAKYVSNGSALLNFRCPDCDATGSLYCADAEETSRNEARCALAELADTAALDRLWPGFWTGERSAEELVDSISGVLNQTQEVEVEVAGAAPELLGQVMQHLPTLITDPERRGCFQLAFFRRYPKILTPCCSVSFCFKCKIGDWHDGESCEDRQRAEMDINVQFCPECGVPTVKSEGCDHIVCVCGANWYWRENPLANAVESGQIEFIQTALKDGLDINSDIGDGENMLHMAVRARKIDVARFLLEQGADINSVTAEDITALSLCLRQPYRPETLEMVEMLVNAGSEVGPPLASWISGMTMYTAEQHEGSETERELTLGVPLVQFLLKKCPVQDISEESSTSPLMEAMRAGLMHVASALVASGLPQSVLDGADRRGSRPLFLAVGKGDLDLVRMLLSAKASPNQTGPESTPPLHTALRASSSTIVQELLASKSSVDIVDSSGVNALHCALQACTDEEAATVDTIQEIIGRVAELDAVTSTGQTAVSISASKGLSWALEALLQRGADMHRSAPEGWTPLGFAASNGDLKTVDLLLERSACVEGDGTCFRAPLHAASAWKCEGDTRRTGGLVHQGSSACWKHFTNRSDVVAALVRHGANVEAVREEGATPLMLAVTLQAEEHTMLSESQQAVICSLLEGRADVSRATVLALDSANKCRSHGEEQSALWLEKRFGQQCDSV